MTAERLPQNILGLFAPRPPLRYLPYHDRALEERKSCRVTGVSDYVLMLKDYDKDFTPTDGWAERREKKKIERAKAQQERLKLAFEKWKPGDDPMVRGDPYKTLFISRLNYQVNEQDLDREFVKFGPIEKIRVVKDKENKQRGYAFIVYERERDMKAAYKETDGLKIKGRRIVVDVERGRTVKGWKPRRLGGGLGGRGYTRAPRDIPSRAAESRFGGDRNGLRPGRSGSFRGGRGGGFGDRSERGGGDRGGFRGGFRGDRRGSRGGIGFHGGRGAGGPPSGPRGFDRPPPAGPSGFQPPAAAGFGAPQQFVPAGHESRGHARPEDHHGRRREDDGGRDYKRPRF
ncbi:U1 small nuclear ribonucleoprotein [Neolecta irregularis DAH-3]|uniref:U1 small nuclear ribonucleoprotein n=1 Tax=Neolecta irregularis (strain DAH-3) TaxID=1198029 RepID=A0A1U7LKH0_NEOID|nr:U1 small nuclear ribonucleoprotein [Neolecta irregularis DAH-3]|eukprot:OLL23147.1 U1 small nuclear ribonucleoprotein [Neolecta irregularis DAH-3]